MSAWNLKTKRRWRRHRLPGGGRLLPDDWFPLDGGFTLVELLVTMAMVSIIFVGIASGLSGATAAWKMARDTAIAGFLGQQILEQIAREPDIVGIDVTQNTEQNTETENGGDFSDLGYPEFSWQMEVEALASGELYRVKVKVLWDDRGKTREKELVTWVQPGEGNLESQGMEF